VRAYCSPPNTTVLVGSPAVEPDVPHFLICHPTPQRGLLASMSKQLVSHSIYLALTVFNDANVLKTQTIELVSD
jgi:hypothetical protein